MPMSEVLQFIPCGSCGKQAQKAIGGFAVVGRASASVGDGPAPWDDEGGFDDMDDGGHSHDFGGHGHSHGPGGHTHGHSHGADGLDHGIPDDLGF